RFSRDWSSDVCSSDLARPAPGAAAGEDRPRYGGGAVALFGAAERGRGAGAVDGRSRRRGAPGGSAGTPAGVARDHPIAGRVRGRSEERRVGKGVELGG